MAKRSRVALVVLGFLGLAGSVGAQPGAAADAFRARLPEIASSFREGYGRVDDELRWAPYLCLMPRPSRARVSAATSGHGQKVYFVYASDRDAYLQRTAAQQRALPVGFTVVKESFAARTELPRLTRQGDEYAFPDERAPHPYSAHALHDAMGRVVVPGEPAGLYVMQFVGARVRGTDRGWLYATIDAGGEITAAGVIESCTGCHARAPHGRLFGLSRE